MLSPLYMQEFLALHPSQMAVFQELIMWGNQGANGMPPTDMAIERALAWAKQQPIPPEAPKPAEEDES